MKQVLYVTAILLCMAACSGNKGIVKIAPDAEAAQKDSVEYELIVFDAGFESWYTIQNSPARYRSQEYYENWNRQYVAAWNYNALHHRRRSFFEPIIGYEEGADYGFELNHKLFYYFQYVEHVLSIKIMPNGPRGVVF